VDSLPINNLPKLWITQSIIKNMLSKGFFGLTGSILAENCLVYNCGEYNVDLALGGAYRFTHCTFANYSNDVIEHEKPVLRVANFLDIGNQRLAGPLITEFINCIAYGSRDSSEVALNKIEGVQYDVTFDHALLKKDQKGDKANYTNVILNESPLFKSTEAQGDYHLKSGSPAIDAGKSTSLSDDLENTGRDGSPDLGAYEFH
jgi:hypothetical protein